MRTLTGAVLIGSRIVAVVTIGACAPSRAAVHHAFATPGEAGAPREASVPAEPVEATTVVHVINETAQSYRVSIVFSSVTRVLGSVSGLETHDFTISRRSVAGFDEYQLVVAARDGTQRRESEIFPLGGVRVVQWILDGRSSRSVTLR